MENRVPKRGPRYNSRRGGTERQPWPDGRHGANRTAQPDRFFPRGKLGSRDDPLFAEWKGGRGGREKGGLPVDETMLEARGKRAHTERFHGLSQRPEGAANRSTRTRNELDPTAPRNQFRPTTSVQGRGEPKSAPWWGIIMKTRLPRSLVFMSFRLQHTPMLEKTFGPRP
jgi:hypothetical protein